MDLMVADSFITVRIDSSRLLNKCLLSFGNGNVLEHVIQRALNNGLKPIVCTSKSPNNDIIEEISIRHKIRCYRGHEDDKLRRWLECAQKYNIDYFHTIDADDPYFDPLLVKYSLSVLNDEELDYVEPTDLSSNGNASVGYSITRNIIEKACDLYKEGTDTELPWYFLEKVPGVKHKKLAENHLTSKTKARLTLDYEEDYWMLCSLCRILGNDATRKDIDAFLIKNPDFIKINFFRNDQWKDLQNSRNPYT
jgi:spore coat polysaccharide biosynthesis protein SpsF